MANATSALRMSGMNSGLDTEAIVNALTATTKNKINVNERKVMKLQAQQEAYRSLITSFTNFQNKYLTMASPNTCLKSGSLFNSYNGSLTNDAGTNVKGVTVSSAANANPGSFDVRVNSVATQAMLKSAASSGKAVDLSGCTDSSQDYLMSVTVGGKTKNITFKGGTADEARTNLNEALKTAFGTKNNGDGLVYVGTDNKMVSSSQASVVSTGATIYTKSRTLTAPDMKTGNNTFTITVGQEAKTVSLSTVELSYFNDIIDSSDPSNLKLKDDAKDLEKLDLFKQIALNERTAEIQARFKEFDTTATEAEKTDFANKVWTFKKEAEIASATQKHYDTARINLKVDALNEKQDKIQWDENGSSYTASSALSTKTQNVLDKLNTDYQNKITSGDFQNTDSAGEKYKTFKDYVNENFEKELQFSDDEVKAYLASDNEKAKAIAENIKKDTDAITAKYEGEGVTKPTYDKLSQNDKILYFDKEVYTKTGGGMSEEDYIKAFAAKGGENAAKALNKANIENNLSALSFKDESVNIKAVVNDDGTITIKGVGQLTGLDREFAITADAANKTDFGIDKTDLKGISGQASTSDKLSQLGLSADAKGNYNFKINGVQFSFEADTTIKDMMKKVNASDAGVTMTYTSLTNQFTLTTKDYGIGQNITFEDGSEGLLGALGFSAGATTFIDGKNTSLNVNGVDVETSSNSYTVDGTTFTFTSAAEGTSFTNTVSRDYSKAVTAIKGFIEDYNKLIDEVYGYVDDEPNGSYHFLTDDDKETMNLSESQEEKWEKLAKKGILYRDASLSGIMSKLRAAVYSSVEAPDGKNIGLFSLGITTGNNRKDHGKLLLDPSVTDEMLADKFAKYADEFEKLFNSTEKVNGSERGIAYQFDNIINSAVKVSGDPKERGVLVQKAGVSGTSSATTNVIYDQIKSLKNTIDTLKDRYQKQQDRFWKMYANMETNLGKINGQSSYIQQLMGSM